MTVRLIMSGAVVGQELAAEFGPLPPSMLPVGVQKLYELQLAAVGGHGVVHLVLPEAHTVLRHHLLLSKRHQGVPSICIIGALVTLKHGPFVLRREYVVSDRQSAAARAPEVDRN